jgi:uncharacterized protein (DUF1330 family)
MPAYVIVQITVHDPKNHREYASNIRATAASFGARMLATDAEIKEGSPPYIRTVIGEFPPVEAARSWYESEAYQAILPLRLNSTTGTLVMVEGFSLPPVADA